MRGSVNSAQATRQLLSGHHPVGNADPVMPIW